VDLSDLSSLPGDPSLTVHTNVAMGDKKMPFMKVASKAVARCLGKPESFVVVAVMDEQALIWGGEDAPCALCTVNSLGGINKENNTALSGELTSLMGEFGVTPDRMYTNFWDIGQRENCGYNGVTFAEGPKSAEPAPVTAPTSPAAAAPAVAAAAPVPAPAAAAAPAPAPAAAVSAPAAPAAAVPASVPEPAPAPVPVPVKVVIAQLKKLSDAKILQLWRKGCPELVALWPEGGNKTQWEGVTFDSQGEKGRVVNLELDDMDISGDLPDEIGGLDALITLALDGNAITGVPATIGGLVNLEQLYLSNNMLTSVPAELGQCVSLETLWLNNNQITSLPTELGNIVGLETLHLEHNQLTTLPVELAELAFLEQLDICNNNITELPADFEAGGKLEAQGCSIVRVPA